MIFLHSMYFLWCRTVTFSRDHQRDSLAHDALLLTADTRHSHFDDYRYSDFNNCDVSKHFHDFIHSHSHSNSYDCRHSHNYFSDRGNCDLIDRSVYRHFHDCIHSHIHINSSECRHRQSFGDCKHKDVDYCGVHKHSNNSTHFQTLVN